MSSFFRGGAQSIVGNTARKLVPVASDTLGNPTPAPDSAATKARTPLSLVVTVPRRNWKPLIVLVLLLASAALAAVLVMSVSLSQGQYKLVDLKTAQSNLEKSNQALELDLSAQRAPQNLVSRASGMGMVPAASTGQIDVRSQKVSGNPLPATLDTKGLVSIPAADVNKPKDQAGAAPLSPAAKDSGGTTAPGQNTPGKEIAPIVPAAPEPAAPDLNGGTIPAPAQKGS